MPRIRVLEEWHDVDEVDTRDGEIREATEGSQQAYLCTGKFGGRGGGGGGLLSRGILTAAGGGRASVSTAGFSKPCLPRS